MCNEAPPYNFSAEERAYLTAAGRCLTPTEIAKIDRLVKSVSDRSAYTGAHMNDVGEITGLFAKHLGLSDIEALALQQAARLHDVGKRAIPVDLLDKPHLTPDEFGVMNMHIPLGHSIIAGSDLAAPFRHLAVEIASQHHEFYNGTGYPGKKSQHDISLGARIVTPVDAYHAMTTPRPYNDTVLTPTEALARMTNVKHRYDPAFGQAFITMMQETQALKPKKLRVLPLALPQQPQYRGPSL